MQDVVEGDAQAEVAHHLVGILGVQCVPHGSEDVSTGEHTMRWCKYGASMGIGEHREAKGGTAELKTSMTLLSGNAIQSCDIKNQPIQFERTPNIYTHATR